MNIILSDENEEYIEDKNQFHEINTNNQKCNKIIKYFKGIWIYFKDYVLFLKGNTIKIFKMLNYATYHWGFQMIMAIGILESYSSVNIMAENFAPHLNNEGEIE